MVQFRRIAYCRFEQEGSLHLLIQQSFSVRYLIGDKLQISTVVESIPYEHSKFSILSYYLLLLVG